MTDTEKGGPRAYWAEEAADALEKFDDEVALRGRPPGDTLLLHSIACSLLALASVEA